MAPINLTELIRGLLVVMALAVALGRGENYENLLRPKSSRKSHAATDSGIFFGAISGAPAPTL